MKKAIFTFAIAFLVISCTSKEDSAAPTTLDTELEKILLATSNGKGKSFYILPKSNDFDKIPQDPKNPITAEKVALGKLLFHETALGRNPVVESSNSTYSCASCHHVKAGFQACVPQGIGDGGVGFGVQGEKRAKNPLYKDSEIDVQPIRTPSALNIAYQTNILWNGQFGATNLNVGTEASWTKGTPKEKNNLGFEGTEIQAIAGQDVHRLFITKSFVESNSIYNDLFKKAFPKMNTNDNLEYKINAGLAIAAYERTLLSTEAPFQQWLNGNYGALSEVEKKGATLFFGKASCVTCHNSPSLASMKFYALGVNDLQNGNYGINTVFAVTEAKAEHKGRGGFTGKAEDMYKFKVPQLYNLKDSPFYFHGSSFTKIEDVIIYKNIAKPQNTKVPLTQIAPEFKPLNLTNEEIVQLTEFIKNGLYDRNLQRFAPQKLPSGLAFPNNDLQSRKDLGF
ncbi:MAG: cytochrome-c peroxidase [Spirosomaceae bacterium]|jgi:cytochrome c peroxidase|nr:cytochrome-c peroxidase [Spirosomataceae bacterium]